MGKPRRGERHRASGNCRQLRWVEIPAREEMKKNYDEKRKDESKDVGRDLPIKNVRSQAGKFENYFEDSGEPWKVFCRRVACCDESFMNSFWLCVVMYD